MVPDHPGAIRADRVVLRRRELLLLCASRPVRSRRLHHASPAVPEALGHPGHEAPPDGRYRDARGIPARGPAAGRSGDPGEAEADPDLPTEPSEPSIQSQIPIPGPAFRVWVGSLAGLRAW